MHDGAVAPGIPLRDAMTPTHKLARNLHRGAVGTGLRDWRRRGWPRAVAVALHRLPLAGIQRRRSCASRRVRTPGRTGQRIYLLRRADVLAAGMDRRSTRPLDRRPRKAAPGQRMGVNVPDAMERSTSLRLTDMSLFGAHKYAWNEWADPNPPARACLLSPQLWRPGLLVEIMATAAR